MIAFDDGDGITGLDVRGGRGEGEIGPGEGTEVRDGDVRDAVGVLAGAGEEFGVLEAVCGALPGVAGGGNVLRDKAEVGRRLVDDGGAEVEGLGDEIALSRTVAVCGCGGKAGRGIEGAEGVDDGVVITDPAPEDVVSAIDVEVEANQLFVKVEWIAGGDREIVRRSGCVGVLPRRVDQGVHFRDRRAVGRDQGGDVVVRNWSFGSWVVELRDSREITRKLRGTGCGQHGGCLLLTQPLDLFAREEEEPVLVNGSADASAEIVIDEVGFGCGEEWPCVEEVVAQVLEDDAVELVGAALGDDVEGGSGGASELGGEVGRFDFDFLDEVGADVVDQAAVAAGGLVVGAVDGEIRGVSAVAVDDLVGGGEASGDGKDVRIGDDGAGDERDELGVVAAIEREVLDLFGVDDVGKLAAGGVERFAAGGGDADDFISAADLEVEVGGDVGVGGDGQTAALLAVVAVHRDCDGVVADGEIGDDIEAAVVGDDGVDCLGADLRDGDGCAGNDAAGGVADDTLDLAERGLGIEPMGREKQCGRCEKEAKRESRG